MPTVPTRESRPKRRIYSSIIPFTKNGVVDVHAAKSKLAELELDTACSEEYVADRWRISASVRESGIQI